MPDQLQNEPPRRAPLNERLYSLLKTMQITILVMALFYVGLGEMLRRERVVDVTRVFYGMLFAASIEALAVIRIRRALIVRDETALRADLESRPLLTALRKWYVLALALSVGVSVFGFTLRIMGSTVPQATIFYAVGIVLILYCTPRRPF